MDLIIRVSQFILSISLLVILHELGHFIPAKLFKTKVEKFYLFFDAKFSIWKKKIGETEYGIGWIPFGGYVKISGMIDESMDTEQLEKAPQPWEFRSKPAWQRLIIMIGGVVVNIIVAIIIYIGILTVWGKDYIPMESLKDGLWITKPELADHIKLQTGDKILSVDGKPVLGYQQALNSIVIGDSLIIDRQGEKIAVDIPINYIEILENAKDEQKVFYAPRMPFIIKGFINGTVNESLGLEAKDRIMAINDESVEYFDMVANVLNKYKGQTVKVDVVREDKEMTLQLEVNNEGKLGVMQYMATSPELEKLGLLKIEHDRYSFGEAIPAGFKMTYTSFIDYIKQFRKIVNPETGAYKSVGGMIKMTKLFPSEWNWRYFWHITAILSIMLAFLNILPIPALDGGHVMFVLYEMVTRKKPSQKVLETAQILGFFIVVGLILIVNGKDVIEEITSFLNKS